MKATVNKDLCIGCEQCVNTCPEVFRMVDGVSTVYADPVPVEAQNNCQNACDDCPVGAISVENAD